MKADCKASKSRETQLERRKKAANWNPVHLEWNWRGEAKIAHRIVNYHEKLSRMLAESEFMASRQLCRIKLVTH